VSGVAIQYLASARSDATRLASQLDVFAHEIDMHRFPDGELRVKVGPAASTTIVYAPLDRPNEKLIALLFAAEALRRDGAKRIVLVAPYLCYMRQDTAFEAGEAISQKVVGRLLAETVDRVLTVDAHLHRTAAIGDVFPGIEADNLSAMPVIADALRASHLDPATIVVGPDAESWSWVCDLAGRLGLQHAIARKLRRNDRTVEIAFPDPGMFAGREVLLVDDIVSSGRTLMACARALATAGAVAIDAILTHALFDTKLDGALAQSGIRSVRSTHSVPHRTNAFVLDELLAQALSGETTSATDLAGLP
jgi:ribose-phosphate pyrophosphokinase